MAFNLLPTNIAHYQVANAPPTAYYIPNFITKDEEEFLIEQVYAAPKPKWTQLSNRRLQNWGGIPHPKGMVAEKLPKWLELYTEKVSALGVFQDKKPNHVLVNEYESGQGIMPHEDGPLFYPVISTISLGSHAILNYYHHPTSQVKSQATESDIQAVDKVCPLEDRLFASLLLEPCSLLISKDDIYSKYLHGINESTTDTLTVKVCNLNSCPGRKPGDLLERNTRISLTIRHVPKVLKVKLKLGKR
ncbi:alpha-ketoglutarate-dependent dioxygenase alkB homolog 6-like isoform X2 [Ptychodera flava]|uniref:alpha-ketoglutarate-dependent dioxygenase alkB homolog 6-like isoform X2 n=1 Tax=Ptychodera flava TaxID=63121 RepID=UPI00396A8FE1